MALVERPGELVEKGALLSRVWPNTFVEEGNLKVNIAALRRALGGASGCDQYIATINGRGYRFVAPVRAFEHIAAPHDTAPALARTHNLPIAPTRIVGRGDAINTLLRRLDASRLVTIAGAGGIGKTTVAIAVAERTTAAFRNGVWFVDLAPLNDPTLVPEAIAAAIGLTVHSANTNSALIAFLRDRQLLLVLDNCEHIIDAVAVCVERLLAGAVGVHVLATSREPLRARGESVYRLLPLETPERSHGLGMADAMAFPAIELFVERASASCGSFVLDDANAPVIAEICQKLDGVALALELAATLVDSFGITEIYDLLDDRFRLLKGWRTAPERHQTLTAMLDWSYDLLSEDERTILRRLSVFAGIFSLQSACAVVADEKEDRRNIVEGLANLVGKSLVTVEARGGTTRYRLLETTRYYALRRLAEDDELDKFRQRHAEHVRDLAEQAEADWKILPTSEWHVVYAHMVNDIRSALGWAFTEGRNIALGVSLTASAISFWEHLSLIEECRACVERALDAIADNTLDVRDEMKLCMALGTTLLHTRGPLPKVKLVWTKTLQIAEQLGDTEYQIRCLWGLCDYHTWTGNHRAALAIAHRIRAVASGCGDSSAIINVDRQIGTALRYLGRASEARFHLERMIDRYVAPVVRSDIARFQLDPRLAARGTLANVLLLQGYLDQAVQVAQCQLDGAKAAGHALALCNTLVHAACPVALFIGDLVTAERHLAMIQDHVAQHAMAVWDSMGRCLRGEWLLKHGDASGLTFLRDALDELSEVGFRMRYPAHLGTLAEGLAAHGDVDAAHGAIDEAIALAARNGEIWCMPDLLRIKGDVLCSAPSAKSTQGAEDHYRQALEEARRQGALLWELRAAVGLAELRHRSAGNEAVTDLLRSTYNRFEEGFGACDLLRARSILDRPSAATMPNDRSPKAQEPAPKPSAVTVRNG